MENLVKGLLFSIITVFAITIICIVTIPWLWNWIVFIWVSPLPAGAATRVYIYESIEAIAPLGLALIFGIVGYRFIVDFFRPESDSSNTVEIYTKPSPTPTSSTKNNATQTLPKQDLGTSTQSRGGVTYSESDGILTGTFTHKEYNTLDGLEPGSKKAQEVYKTSEERAERLAEIYELEKKIQEAQKNNYANEKLKSVKPRFGITEERTKDVQLLEEG